MAEILPLNVGGVPYETTRSTLTRFQDSMLGAMFSGRHPVTTDDKGRYFIDGDGPLFRFVLNFLRRSELALPDDFKELDMLLKEARFYQLDLMVSEIEKRMKDGNKPHMAREALKVWCNTLIYKTMGNWFYIRGEVSTIDGFLAILNLRSGKWQQLIYKDSYQNIEHCLHLVKDSETCPIKQVSLVYMKTQSYNEAPGGGRVDDGDKGDPVIHIICRLAEYGFTLTSESKVGDGMDWRFIRN